LADENPNSRFKDCVEIGGLLLCKMPEERVKQRRAYYDNMNKAQMDGVDNSFLRERDGRSNMDMFTEKIYGLLWTWEVIFNFLGDFNGISDCFGPIRAKTG